jgi:VWFA-related protein
MARHCAREVAVAAAVVATVSGAGAQDQQPAPTFRSEINYVQIPVRVLDAHGEFVNGLTQSDFEIFEDGQPQTITAFTAINIPFVRRESPAPGAQSPSGRAAGPEEPAQIDGRVYVLILDNQAMDAATALRTQHVLRGFLDEGLAANDLAGIAFTGQGRGQTFTRDRRLLDAAIGRLMGDVDPTDNQSHRLANFIADTAKAMGTIRDRRKGLILVTASTICSIDNSECRESLEHALRTCIESDVSVYVVDSRGLNAYERTRSEYANPNSRYVDGGYAEARNGEAARAAFSAFRAEFHGPFSGARYLAEESGGFAVVNSNGLDQGFERIVRENSVYYRLGYYSTNTRADGKLRRNQVTVSRQSVRVIHRKGYLAPRNAPKN